MTTVEWTDGKVRFIDQTRLPGEEVYVETSEYRVVGEAISHLRIRGAPAIGVAAAFGLVLAVREGHTVSALRRSFEECMEHLRSTRPTAVNLFHALDRMKAVSDRFPVSSSPDGYRGALLSEALAIRDEDVLACRNIGMHGAKLIQPGSSVLTHCNAGALATVGEGTALSVIFAAARQNLITRVYVDETRPLFQGARLTSWELVKAGIEVVLITDNSAGLVISRQKVQAIIVGADRIAANGDTANKIGTYPLAVLARRHNVPFYVAAPTSTLDLSTPSGSEITIEERKPEEVTHIAGVRIAAEGVRVFAPAFDVTPNELVTAIITNAGVARPPYVKSLAMLRSRTEQAVAGAS